MAGGEPGVQLPQLWSVCHRFLEACFVGALPNLQILQTDNKKSKREAQHFG